MAAAASTRCALFVRTSIPSSSCAASKTTTRKTTAVSSFFPASRRLLASLPPDRWTIVTSATTRLLEGRLGYAGLPIPAVLVPAEKVANGKPHPEPYLTGAKLLGFAPADCLVIEDSPAGVASGKAAGCRVLALLSSHTQAELTGADWFVASLEQVTASAANGWDSEYSSGYVTVRSESYSNRYSVTFSVCNARGSKRQNSPWSFSSPFSRRPAIHLPFS